MLSDILHSQTTEQINKKR